MKKLCIFLAALLLFAAPTSVLAITPQLKYAGAGTYERWTEEAD